MHLSIKTNYLLFNKLQVRIFINKIWKDYLNLTSNTIELQWYICVIQKDIIKK